MTFEIKSIEIVDASEPLPVGELLASARIERTYLIEMVDAGIISPRGTSIDQWTFVRGDLRRLQIAQRLMTDLDVNVAGAALVLDLLDERDALLKDIGSIRSLLDF